MRALVVLALFGALLGACSEENGSAGGGQATAARTPARTASATDPPATAVASPGDSPAASPSTGCQAPPRFDPAVADVFCADTHGMELARVVRVIDGDTLVVQIDGREESVRIFGVDAAERGDRCYIDAASTLEELAAGAVLLRPDERDRDRYDRLLRYVYTPAGLSVDAVLIAAGLAEAWRADGALRDDLVALEEDARAARRGCLWEAP